jgi:hypothetical protein
MDGPSNAAPGSSAAALAPDPAPAAQKPRSCVTCRQRKVRCDKQTPCSNCRRGGIPCVLPSPERTPRWARRLARNNAAAAAAGASQLLQPASGAQIGADVSAAPTNAGVAPGVMERLRILESLVKDLSGQLAGAEGGPDVRRVAVEGAQLDTAPNRAVREHEGDQVLRVEAVAAPDAAVAGSQGIHQQFGRLVLQDPSRSRYVSAGFWSRVHDEVLLGLFSLMH